MKKKYVIALCGLFFLLGCAASWLYVKKHTVHFGPFDRSLYEACIDWVPPLVLSVRTEGTNRVCWATGREIIKTTNYDSIVQKLAALDPNHSVFIAVGTNMTIAEIDNLITFTTNHGINNFKVLIEAEPTTPNSLDDIPLREMRISQSRTIYGHMYEWYIESEREKVQLSAGGDGKPAHRQ